MADHILHEDPISVLIPDGESFFALPVLQALGRIGNIKAYVLSDNPTSSIRYSKYTHKFLSFPAETGNEGRLSAILSLVKTNKIDILLPIDEPFIRFIAENGNELQKYTASTPLPDPKTFDTVVNKWLFAEWLIQNNFPVPPTILYHSDASFDDSISTFGFPALIKPAIGNGGIGIKIFDDRQSLTDYCRENIRPGEFIVQSYIPGYDIGCSVLCNDGKILACTFQKRAENVRGTFSPFTNINFLFDQNIYEVIENMIAKLNWSGVAHFDLRYDERDNTVKILEINARYWQSILGSYYAGVNFPYLAALTGLNRKLPEVDFQPIRYVNPATTFKLLLRCLVTGKKPNYYYDKSRLETHLRDPLPIIISKVNELSRKAGRFLRKKFKAER